MKKRADFLKGIRVCVAICTIGFVAYVSYIEKLKDYSTESVLATLTETAVQQKFNIKQGLDLDARLLVDVAKYLEEPGHSEAERTVLMTDLVRKTHFSALNYFDASGTPAISVGRGVDFPPPDAPGIQMASDKVAYTLSEKETDQFLMSAPVRGANGQAAGLLVGSHEIDRLRGVLLPFFLGKGNTCLVSKSGGYVVSSHNFIAEMGLEQNNFDFWQMMSETKPLSHDTAAQMMEHIRQDQSGNMIFELGGKKQYAHYAPAEISDWYVFTSVDDKTVALNTRVALRTAFALTVIMLATFSILIFYIFRQQHKHNSALERVAYYDELCNCFNLQKFKIRAQQFISQHPNENFVMIKLDINHFKLVNQTLGKETGDLILKNVSVALRENAENNECRFARAHDDEFYVLHRYRDQSDLRSMRFAFYESFLNRMGKSFTYHIKFISGAYYMSLENCHNVAEAIEKANIAHQKAKATASEVCVYDKTFIKDALRKQHIEARMELALQNKEFQVYLQPQHGFSTDSVIGAEALVRWNVNTDDNIYPDEFIPIFEENNFVIRLDMYMFDQVCQIIRGWIDSGLTPVAVSVNFARNHLANPEFANELCKIADRYQIPRHLLKVELTERVIAQGQELSMLILESLHENGFALAMDDFGTGYSSLGLLKNTPVDVIKIDRSFFERADDQPRTKAVLCNVLRLAKDLQAYTIAEGVETAETANLLREFGCDAIQGYYYGRPVKASEFTKTLLQRALSDAQESPASIV